MNEINNINQESSQEESLNPSALFLNRELSFLQFNQRVLDQALDTNVPLLERLKYFAICSSNFDEFFMVRVASVKRLLKTSPNKKDPSNLYPHEQMEKIREKVLEIKDKQNGLLDYFFLELEKEGIRYYRRDSWDIEIRTYLENYFRNELLHLISPIRFELITKSDEQNKGKQSGDEQTGDEQDENDISENIGSSNSNKNLHENLYEDLISKKSSSNIQNLIPNIAFLLQKDSVKYMSIISVNPKIKRVIFIPYKDKVSYVLVEDIVKEFAKEIFTGYEIVDSVVFSIARDADFAVDEDEDNFISAMEKVLEDRNFSQIIKIDIENKNSPATSLLISQLNISDSDIYINSLVDFRFFFQISGIKGFPHLNFREHQEIMLPILKQKQDVWDAIKKQDILLFPPFNSFSFVVDMIETASKDPDVVSIKMTLYRVSGNSPIIRHLQTALENGKQVIILFEIKARFDEGNNIEWARVLQKAGAIVIYGIKGLKVHAKSLLILRRENNVLKKYIHLSTGNYNDKTAKLYTDVSLITCSDSLSYDVSLFFNMITGYSDGKDFSNIFVAPFTLKDRLLYMIQKEIDAVKNSQSASIIMKMNSINDPDVIKKLYQASRHGVRIYLNVRGICTLIPNENIIVNSVVGRYLEHARIFYFLANGQEEVYLASADCMVRNLEKRIELMFPVKDKQLKARLKNILHTCINDNTNSYILKPDGTYQKKIRSEEDEPLNSQEYFYNTAFFEYQSLKVPMEVRKLERLDSE